MTIFKRIAVVAVLSGGAILAYTSGVGTVQQSSAESSFASLPTGTFRISLGSSDPIKSRGFVELAVHNRSRSKEEFVRLSVMDDRGTPVDTQDYMIPPLGIVVLTSISPAGSFVTCEVHAAPSAELQAVAFTEPSSPPQYSDLIDRYPIPLGGKDVEILLDKFGPIQ